MSSFSCLQIEKRADFGWWHKQANEQWYPEVLMPGSLSSWIQDSGDQR
jgi:hypothetical protein